MQITLYENFAKKDNSTLRPSIGGTVIDCFLKNSTSITNPTFVLTVENFNITYVKWNNRFYFVSNITSLKNGVIEINCKIDVLATYKMDILSTTSYVEYSSSKYNSMILDERISNTSNLLRNVKYGSESLDKFSSAGCYRISINGGGVSQFYYLSEDGLKNLATSISNITDNDIINSLVLKFGSVFSAVNGCVYLPFNFPSSDISGIWIGDYQTSVAGYVTKNYYQTQGTVIKIPWIHDDICRRITENIYMYLPAIGTIQLDSSQLFKTETLTINCFYDYIDGNVAYAIKADDLIFYYSAMVGSSVEFGITTRNLKGTLLQDSWKSFSTFFSLKDFSTVTDSNLYNIVNSKINSVGSSFSTIGSFGGRSDGARASQFSQVIIVNESFEFSCKQSDIALQLGRPLKKVIKLSELSGYCKCNGASVSVACDENERQEINSYINNGFYIE